MVTPFPCTPKSMPLSPLHGKIERDVSPSSVVREWHARTPSSSSVSDLESQSSVAGKPRRDHDTSRSRRSPVVKKALVWDPPCQPRTHNVRSVTSDRNRSASDAMQIFLGGCRLGATKDKRRKSLSLQAEDLMEAIESVTSSRHFRGSLASLGLIGTPLVFYGTFYYGTFLTDSPVGLFLAINNFWDGCLLLSSRMVFSCCIVISFFYALTEERTTPKGATPKGAPPASKTKSLPPKSSSFRTKATHFLLCSPSIRFHRIAFCVMLFIIILIGVIGPWSLIFPSWLWHPFLWGQYEVYWPSRLAPALHGLCVDYSLDEGKNGRLPLCLTKEDWNVLSTGKLSSASQSDLEVVLAGIAYGKQQSGGIVVSVLARDVVEFIAPLRQNVESLVPFFSNVSVVIFENDSKDGSREAFKRWSSVVKGYTVDLIECDDAVDCRFGKIHRDDVGDFSHSSAVGDMHKYRQRVVDYVLTAPQYQDYSHMIVLDIDLAVSISPFGILHTLGGMPDHPVASVGRQPWPTAFGTLITPYDMSAFRPHVTNRNQLLVWAHEAFCRVMPPGDRWRNECGATSPFQMIEMLNHDRAKDSFVRVASAFNGAVMYPIQLIRDSHAQYDSGDDGQRCEHVGFHMSLNKVMYMNRKWDMHLSPTIPGGPNGHRAEKTASRIAFTPRLVWMLNAIHVGFTSIFVWSSMSLGAFVIFPFLFPGRYTVLDQSSRRRRQTFGVKMV